MFSIGCGLHAGVESKIFCSHECFAMNYMALLLMAEILHQLSLVVFPIIYRVSAPSQVVVWDFSHQQ